MIRKRPSTTALLSVAVFAAIVAAALFAKASFFFHDDVLPFTDYASNDILVTWAKDWLLWHGNYSRVGFYHPGPFFFQLMALSEIAFHDTLPIFHTPFAAQVFATLCICACAIALVSALLHKLTGHVSTALVGTAAYAIVLLLAKAYSLSAPWPPFLYVTASTVLSVGLCGLLLRGWRWLPWLILGAGAMVHGHASFVGLVPVICVVTVLGAALAMRLRWLPRPSVTIPPTSTVVVSLALIVLFLLPVSLQTFNYWPGEFPKYFAFAGHRAPNPAFAVVRYVFDFMPLWGIVLPLVALGAWLMRGTENARAVLVGLLVLAAGLVAALLYGRKGVDDLQYRYLEYWFVPFYAILVAITAACMIEWSQRAHRAASAVIAVFAIGGVVYLGSQSEELLQNPASVSEAPYRNALQAITASAGGKVVELSIDREGGWDVGWSDTVSLLAYANRVGHGKAQMCIAPESWHLLFHTQYRCPEAGRRAQVLVSGKFYPERKQIVATTNARYYVGDGSHALVREPGSGRAGDESLRSDLKLSAMDVAIAMTLQGEPLLEKGTGTVSMRIRIDNRGGTSLAGRGQYPVNLAVVQLPNGRGGTDAMPRVEVQRIPLPGVAPGAAVEMPLTVPLSRFAKGAVVRLELVQEGVAWFTYDYGLPPLDIGPLQTCKDQPERLCEGAVLVR
ncbi:hypothetical protein ACI6Q5_08140 [Xanthomonas codiaei]|nr:hypothetical protein [Xanthomonas codiaei]